MIFSYAQNLAVYFQRTERFYFVITDSRGQFIYANPLFEKHSGYKVHQLSGFCMPDFIAGGKVNECVSAMEECNRNKSSVSLPALPFLFQNSSCPYILWELNPVTEENGLSGCLQWLGTAVAATVDPETSDDQRRDELFYQNLIAHSLDGVIVTDENGVIRFASPSVTEILGYETEETIGKATFDYAHPEDRALTIAAFRDEIARTPKRQFIRVRLQKKSGEWLWCIVRGHNLLQNPYVSGVIVYFYDDTPRKKIEDALIESERRFRNQATILQNATDVIVTTDANLVISSWNKVCEELSGISAEEAVGKFYRDIIPLDFSPFTREQVAEQVFSIWVWRGEVSFTAKNGEKKYLLQTISLLQDDDGKGVGILGVGKDITERKKIEAKLKESELFYRNMISHSLDGIIMVNTAGEITYCGPSVTKISGYEPQQLLGHNLFEFVHPDDLEPAKASFILELNKQSTLYYIFLRLRHSDGGWRWCSVRAHNLMNTPGINSMVIYFTEETKRKLIEDRLRESEERFRHMINNLKLGVILQNEKSETLVCNQAALDLLGLTENQLLGKISFDPDWNIIHEDGTEFPGHTHPVPVAIQTKKSVADVVMGVYRPSKEDRVWLLVNAEPILGSDNNIINVICSFTDITEQRRLSQQLIDLEIQKQKQLMQATIDGQERERKEIGRELHDNISQHTTTTRLYLEVARDKATGEVLDLISHAHRGLLNTVNEMRKLSQSLVPPSLSDIGLVESIEDLCSPLKSTHAFTISFRHYPFNESLLPDNMKLMLFRIIQEQVNNIIRHAHADTILITLQTSADQVKLSVTDNGRGFNPSSVKKGLGFANISNRADLFGGTLKIESSPGKGCSIRLLIPLPKSSL